MSGAPLPVQARQHRAGVLHVRHVGPVGEQAVDPRQHLPRLQGLALRRLQPREVGGRAQLEQVWARPYLAADA